MEIEKPFEIVAKDKEIPKGMTVEATNPDGKKVAQTATVELTFHNKMWNDFSVGWMPHDFDAHLLPMLLRRVADKVEIDLLQHRQEKISAERGEIVTLNDVEHIVVDVPPGHESPTLVADWTSPKVFEVPLLSASVGANKVAMWTGCIAANKPHMGHGIKELYGQGKGRKVIIAGSGPSLQVKRLKDLPHDWDIIACNDAYRLLDGKPKYAFFMEAEANSKWWSKIGDTECINSIYSHPAIAQQEWNTLYWFAAFPPKPGIPSNDELGDKFGKLHEQLNCTISAFHLAYLMGYETVAFVGCDFAYTDGKSHYQEPAEERQFIYSYAEAVGGGLVLTDKMLALQARCHEAAAYWMDKAGIKVFNCTEGGCMIGMKCKPLDEILNTGGGK